MNNRESFEIIFPYQQNALNELNLIGLKYRYALKEKPEECKNICLKNEIKFNRIFGKNIFLKVNQGKHTFRDFDHIIVPKYIKKKVTLHQYIQNEMNKVSKATKLKNILLHPKITPIKMYKSTSTKEFSTKNDFPLLSIKKESLFVKNDMSIGAASRSIERNISARNNPKIPKSLEKITFDGSYPIFLNKNTDYITLKGGVMNKASLWRSKNMNHLVRFESRQKVKVNDDAQFKTADRNWSEMKP